MCGGTTTEGAIAQVTYGLSPRVRGNLLPSVWDAAQAFAACATQWRVGPAGGLLGLDYAAAQAAVRGVTADGHGDERRGRRLRWRRVFPLLREMEAGALDARPGRRGRQGAGH